MWMVWFVCILVSYRTTYAWIASGLPQVISEGAKLFHDVIKSEANAYESENTPQEVWRTSYRDEASKTLRGIKCDEIDVILHQAVNQTLPESKGSTHTSVGTLHYDIKNTVVKSVNHPSCQVTFHLTSADIKLSNLSITLHGHWWIKIGSIQASGTMDVLGKDISVALNVSLPIVAELKKYHVLSCKTVVAHLQINLHGSTSFFYQPFVNHYIPEIKQQIDELVCKEL